MWICYWRSVQVDLNRRLIVCALVFSSQLLCKGVHSLSDFPSPPQFPNILFAFRESLSVSEDLVQLANGIGSNSAINCGCRVSASINSTGYPVVYSRDNLTAISCSGKYVLVSNDSRELKATQEPVSAEMIEQKTGMAAGLSISLITVLSVLIFVIIIVRRRSCRVLALHGRRSNVGIQRQRSDCQEMITKDYQTDDFCCPSPVGPSSDITVGVCCNFGKSNSSSSTSSDVKSPFSLPIDRSVGAPLHPILNDLHGSVGPSMKDVNRGVTRSEQNGQTLSCNAWENIQCSVPYLFNDVACNLDMFGGSNHCIPVASSRF